MSSILTNNSAMVALQTLKMVNSNLSKAQDEISTGKSVASAKDNAAVWAVSKVMESDVKGFKAISESLSLGQSTVNVASKASETVTDLLTEIKGKIVASQEDNIDRTKVQTDIAALRDQITSVVNSAQFNGQNLLKGSETMDILASLDRSSDGTVTPNKITVNRQSLEQTAATFGTGADLTVGGTPSATTLSAASSLTIDIGTAANSTAYTVTLNGNDYSFTSDADATIAEIQAGLASAIGTNEEGVTVANEGTTGINIVGSGGANGTIAVSGGALAAAGSATEYGPEAQTITFDSGATIAENDSFQIAVGTSQYNFVAGTGATAESVVDGLVAAINADAAAGFTATKVANGGNFDLALTAGAADVTYSFGQKADGVAGGGLETLATIDVSTKDSATAALGAIEDLIQTSIVAAAEFGSAQKRIEIQNDFVSQLTDSLKSGIGTLVDANMEEASARLQALQVQQQLATQSLSIANQAPQSILSLFR